MNRTDWKLWDNITFKTLGYRKNFDLISQNENIITQYDGMVSELRITKRKPPIPVGEYGFSVWNIELGKKLGVDLKKLIKDHEIENIYSELVAMINKGVLNIEDYSKVVFVNTFILNEAYRKHGITQEFTEMLYRDFYCDNVAIVMLVKPFQENTIDSEYYLQHKAVVLKNRFDGLDARTVSAREYYGLDALMEKNDKELNDYKLFNIASKSGFSRLNESHLFLFSPEKTVERMKEKIEFSQVAETK
jgi:hypothetical protein